MPTTETITTYRMTVTVYAKSVGFTAFRDQRLVELYDRACALEGIADPAASWPVPKLDVEIGIVPLTDPLYRWLLDYRRKTLTFDAVHDIVDAYMRSCDLRPELAVASADHQITPRILFEHLAPNIGGRVSVKLEPA